MKTKCQICKMKVTESGFNGTRFFEGLGWTCGACLRKYCPTDLTLGSMIPLVVALKEQIVEAERVLDQISGVDLVYQNGEYVEGCEDDD